MHRAASQNGHCDGKKEYCNKELDSADDKKVLEKVPSDGLIPLMARRNTATKSSIPLMARRNTATKSSIPLMARMAL